MLPEGSECDATSSQLTFTPSHTALSADGINIAFGPGARQR
jgi:hypothetical protein